jgi:hypothetical protein
MAKRATAPRKRINIEIDSLLMSSLTYRDTLGIHPKFLEFIKTPHTCFENMDYHIPIINENPATVS